MQQHCSCSICGSGVGRAVNLSDDAKILLPLPPLTVASIDCPSFAKSSEQEREDWIDIDHENTFAKKVIEESLPRSKVGSGKGRFLFRWNVSGP